MNSMSNVGACKSGLARIDSLGGSAIRCSDENGAITLEPIVGDELRGNCFYCVAIRSEDVERTCSVFKVIIESFLGNRARNSVQLVYRVELHNLTIIIPVGIRQKQDCHCEFFGIQISQKGTCPAYASELASLSTGPYREPSRAPPLPAGRESKVQCPPR